MQREKRTKLILMILLILFISSLSVWSGGQKEAASQAEKTELVWLNWGTNWKEHYDKIELLYEQANPNVDVKQEQIIVKSYYEQLKLRLAGGEKIDVFDHNWDGELVDFANNGTIVDLHDLPGLKNLKQAALDAAYYKGKVIHLTRVLNWLNVYYNKGTFEKYGLSVPETYNQLCEVCDKLKENNIIPISLGQPQILYLFTYATANQWDEKGPVPFAEKLDKGEITYNNSVFINAAKKIKDMHNRGFFQPDVVGTKRDQATILFAQGKTAMYVDGPWTAKNLRDTNPDVKINFLNIPMGDTAYGQVALGAGACVNSKSGNIETAKDFVNFISCTKEAGAVWQDAYGAPSGVKNVPVEDPVIKEVEKQLTKPSRTWLHNLVRNPEFGSTIRSALDMIMVGGDVVESLNKAYIDFEKAIK